MNNLKIIRQEKGYSQEELAAAINVSPRSVVRWENEGSTINSDALIRIADFLNCTVDALLGRETKEYMQAGKYDFEITPGLVQLLYVYKVLSPSERGNVLAFARSFIM